MTGGARYPPVLSREGKLELTKAQGRSTLAAGIPEGFHPAQPERIAPEGQEAKPEGIPVFPPFPLNKSRSPKGCLIGSAESWVLSPEREGRGERERRDVGGRRLLVWLMVAVQNGRKWRNERDEYHG